MWRRAVAMMGTALITTILLQALAGVAPADATGAGRDFPFLIDGGNIRVSD